MRWDDYCKEWQGFGIHIEGFCSTSAGAEFNEQKDIINYEN
jgi:hypothetical protein